MPRRVTALTPLALIVPALLLRGEGQPAARSEITPPPAAASLSDSGATSPVLLRNIAATLPKYEPKTSSQSPTTSNGAEPPTSAATIVRLPRFLVREPRPIEERDVMTAKAREAAIVKRYVGEPTDLDRMLNQYTLKPLWKKIPLLGPNSDWAAMTPSERIVLDYSRIEARRRYVEALGVSADVPPSKPAAKSESEGDVAPAPPSK